MKKVSKKEFKQQAFFKTIQYEVLKELVMMVTINLMILAYLIHVSVSFALRDGVCKNYWTETGPMNEIAEYIEHNVGAVREDIVKMVAGIPIRVKLKG